MASWDKVVHDNWTSFYSARASAPHKVITTQHTAVEKNAIKLELIFHIGLVICQIYERILYGGLLTVLGVLVFAEENSLFVLWKQYDGNSVDSGHPSIVLSDIFESLCMETFRSEIFLGLVNGRENFQIHCTFLRKLSRVSWPRTRLALVWCKLKSTLPALQKTWYRKSGPDMVDGRFHISYRTAW